MARTASTTKTGTSFLRPTKIGKVKKTKAAANKLATAHDCHICYGVGTVVVEIDRKAKKAYLECQGKNCDAHFHWKGPVHNLTQGLDIWYEWRDATEAVPETRK